MKNLFEKAKNYTKAAAITAGLAMAPLAEKAASSHIETSFSNRQEKNVVEKTFHKEIDAHSYTAIVDYRPDSAGAMYVSKYHFTDFDSEHDITVEIIDEERMISVRDSATIDGTKVPTAIERHKKAGEFADRMVETFPDGKKITVYMGTENNYEIDNWNEVMNIKDNPQYALTKETRDAFLKAMKERHVKLMGIFAGEK